VSDRQPIVLTERDTIAIATVIARKGQHDALSAAFQSHYGIALPAAGKRVEGKGIALVWAGVDQFLAIVDAPMGDLEAELRAKLGATASVSDQSDGRVVLRLSGPHVRDLFAKGTTLDLHPRVFRPGDTALTMMAHIGVHLWQLDDQPTFEIAMFRSLSRGFRKWLAESAAEFGLVSRP
jgi:sarcosine oxidase subunit gamma